MKISAVLLTFTLCSCCFYISWFCLCLEVKVLICQKNCLSCDCSYWDGEVSEKLTACPAKFQSLVADFEVWKVIQSWQLFLVVYSNMARVLGKDHISCIQAPDSGITSLEKRASNNHSNLWKKAFPLVNSTSHSILVNLLLSMNTLNWQRPLIMMLKSFVCNPHPGCNWSYVSIC